MINVEPNDKTDTFFEHHGIKGMHWGRRKAADSSSDSSTSAPKKVKLTRKQVSQEKSDFYQKKANTLLKTADEKGSDVLIKLHDGSAYPTIVTGKEFVDHMLRGGVMDIKVTDIYATKTKDGPYMLNQNPTERFVRSDKKK